MKKYLPLFLFLTISFGQDKYQFLLESDENLKLVGDNYDIIKAELDKMLVEYESQINFSNYWFTLRTSNIEEWKNYDLNKFKSSCRFCGEPYNGRGYSIELGIPNQVEKENDPLNSYCSKICAQECILEECHTRPGKKVKKRRLVIENIEEKVNKILELGDILFTKEAKWSDIVLYVGGYSELSKLGLSKDNKSKFDISVVLEKIEFTGESTCIAYVKIKGGERALEFHKVPKSTYKYEGYYKINYNKDYLTLYSGGNAQIDFSFNENDYLPKSKTQYIEQLDNSLLPSTKNYRNTIITMFDDLVLEEVWNEKINEKSEMKFNEKSEITIEYHDNGQKKYEYTIKNSIRDGAYTAWYENGVKWQEGSYLNGHRDGTWKSWKRSGKPWKDEIFDKGNFLSRKKY